MKKQAYKHVCISTYIQSACYAYIYTYTHFVYTYLYAYMCICILCIYTERERGRGEGGVEEGKEEAGERREGGAEIV